ncbi:alpha/beta fold hydrolase [Variovorax humicola]|uniref:Alpha/beta fold hydrolase n=1 Tax=Variovorax humicola TaxID=1769758 RepID=A0ABU8VVQ9_9BURK
MSEELAKKTGAAATKRARAAANAVPAKVPAKKARAAAPAKVAKLAKPAADAATKPAAKRPAAKSPAVKPVAGPTEKPVAKKAGTPKATIPKAAATKAAAGKAASPRPARAAPAAAAPAPKAEPPKASVKKPAAAVATDSLALVSQLADDAASSTLAVNPFLGMRTQDLGEGVQAFIGAVMQQPAKSAKRWASYAVEMGKVFAGKSAVEGDPKDKRFADPAWRESPLYKRLLQAHLATSKQINGFIEDSEMDPRDKARAQLVASIYIDAIAPSNAMINPMALKRVRETRGKSWLKGMKNLVSDWRHNGGLPSSVDKSKFEIGRNLCLSEGQVVFKNDVLELIQYQPKTPEVYARPLVICPPQVNKFYAMDLSPEKSLVKYVVEHGVQIFCVSWFNPALEQRDWDMSTYVKALDEAVDAAREITGSPDISLWGACSGGMTAASYVGWLAATGQEKVANVISPVCTLDPENTADTSMGLFMTPESVAAIKAATKAKGYVDGESLARVFAWLRPNDLIWSYWVNNYLLGNDPPAFDILYWNADTTRLPAAFHSDLLDIMVKSPFVNAGKLKVLGKPIDMRKVKVDAYIVAGITDHITPWKACYPTARIYGENSTFTLVNAGHLQSLLNPPGGAKSFFLTAKAAGPDPEAWAASAPRTDGSWWPHWMAWMHERSGAKVPAPAKPGSAKHKPGAAAPGEYVLQK